MLYEEFRDTSEQEIMLFKKDLSYPLHFHRGIEVIYCQNKSCNVIIEGNTYMLFPGAVCFVDSSLIHSITDHGENFCLFIPINFLNEFFKAKAGKSALNPLIPPDKTDKIIQLLLNFSNVLNEDMFALRGYTNYFLGNIMRLLTFAELKNNEANTVSKKIMSYILKHYKEDITLTSLSRSLAYNKFYVSTVINTVIKENFNSTLIG